MTSVKENWVNNLVGECSHVETPKSWLYWSFLSCISAAAGNNYHLRTLKGDLNYKPNLYIILLGESGLGKGFGINRAKNLVNKASVTRVIAGRSSIQAVVKELSTAKKLENQAIIEDSRGYIVNGELSTAIIADPDALTILTDLYDGHYNPEWTNLLKGDGAEKLKNPYITALFGSSPSHFYDSVPQVNIEGGYIGRNLIIYEEKRSQDVDLLDESSDEEKAEKDSSKFDSYLVPKYVPHLKKIADMSGQLKPDDSARNFFNTWRREWRARQPPDKTGFLNRVPDHSLKVAMCLALAEYEFDGYIRDYHIKEAIDKVTALVYSSERTTSGTSQDPLTKQTKLMLDMLLEAPDCELERRKILTKFYSRGGGDAVVIDRILDNLHEMAWVAKIKIGVGKNQDLLIRLTGEPREKYEQHLRSLKDKK
jgi:hypothetical protein